MEVNTESEPWMGEEKRLQNAGQLGLSASALSKGGPSKRASKAGSCERALTDSVARGIERQH
jgi:hypothetical protein